MMHLRVVWSPALFVPVLKEHLITNSSTHFLISHPSRCHFLRSFLYYLDVT